MIKRIFLSTLLAVIAFTLFEVFPAAADELKSSPEYIRNLNEALRAKKDVWGEELLQKPEGPTYENIEGYLHPLMYGGSIYTWLSESKVHYLPFGMLDTFDGGKDFALTVADGSQIISDKIDKKRSVSFYVGSQGTEPYGSDLRRLTIALHKGYLPILETEYSDSQGNMYRQESFAFKSAGQPLASFIKFTVRPKMSSTKLKIALSDKGLALNKDRLGSGDKSHLIVSEGAVYQNPNLTYTTKGSQEQSFYLIRLNQPGTWNGPKADAAGYEEARAALIAYWEEQLGKARLISVPEELVMKAQKNLLIQNLLMGSRYSIGNSYEVIFNSESSDSVQSLGWFGYTDIYKDEIHYLVMNQSNSANWEKAMRLKHAAYYYLLTKDDSIFPGIQTRLGKYIDDFAAQIKANPHGLLKTEAGGTDISTGELFYSMHFQADAWRGLRDIATVWGKLGQEDLQKKSRDTADSLHASLRKAIDQSKVKLADDSLFVPVSILDKKAMVAFDPIAETAKGSYWLLVAPYGLASGIFEPHSAEARQILSYLYDHGAFFLGMLRFNYTGVAVGDWVKTKPLPAYRTPGVDNVYALGLVKLMSDNDEADRMVLSFYGKLAHGMTRNTFVSGEGDEVGVFETDYYRTMYLPPNSTNNAMLLFLLRLMLIHEVVDSNGLPTDLELAAATPRAWLEDGKQIRVNGSPTLFGPLSYTIDSHLAKGFIEVALDIPERDPIRKLKLRLRTPGKKTITRVELDGSPHFEFDPKDESINLPSKPGKHTIRVSYGS